MNERSRKVFELYYNAMMYAELGSFPISIYIRKTLIKYWLKIMNSGHYSLLGIVYYNMFNQN